MEGKKTESSCLSNWILILWTHWFVAVVLVKLLLPERKTKTKTKPHFKSKNMVKFLKAGLKKTQCLCAEHTFHIFKYNSVFVERVLSQYINFSQ